MDADAIEDLFQSVGPVAIKKLFGGKGIYADGMIIGIDLRDEIMLKGDAAAGALYEAAGGRQWKYTHKKTEKLVSMPYWSIPEEAFDDPDVAAKWVRVALDAAIRSR